MKRKLMSIFLVLSLLCPLLASFPSAESAAPAPPSWCPEDEYAVFDGGAAYQGETWDTISQLRAYAEEGNLEPQSGTETVLYNRRRALAHSSEPSICFELGLLSIKFAVNAAAQGQQERISSDFEMAAHYAASQEPARYLAYLWNARANLWNNDLSTGLNGELRFYIGAIEPLLIYPQFSMEGVLDWGRAQGLPAEKIATAKDLLFVTLDGNVVHPRAVHYSATSVDTSTALVRGGRTMVPVRRLAELLGAAVDYDTQTRRITITRAGSTIVLTLDSAEALQNGVPFQMDVAPFAESNRTYIPIRYIAEFFGQKVDWIEEKQQVAIYEDKAAVAPSNLEAWALGMGAVLSAENHSGGTTLFGGKRRFGAAPVGSAVTNVLETTGPDFARQSFRNGWPVESRETLIGTIESLLDAPGAYRAWDLFRISSLAQWGYLAGYVTYPEALALIDPAARQLQEEFYSWDDAYENYLNGYAGWSGTDEPDQDIWQTERGIVYQGLKSDPETALLFDDTLFSTGVLGLPFELSFP